MNRALKRNAEVKRGCTKDAHRDYTDLEGNDYGGRNSDSKEFLR